MIISVCANCIKELEKQYPGLNQQIIDKTAEQGKKVSHGLCINHFASVARAGEIPEDTIQTIIQKNKAQFQNPDLRQHPELVQQYLNGNFSATPTTILKERLQKLANIVKEVKNHASSSCH